MKKAIAATVAGILFVGITSCGGGHLCDAYKKADYTKHKTEQTKKVQVNIRKN